MNRELALYALYLGMKIVDRLGRCWKMFRRPPPPKPFKPGLTVLIPERGRPDLLGECLASVDAAFREVSEPCEVLVMVNGSPRSEYQELVRRHKARWMFSESPLWFSGAVARGLRAARYDWVYLLNSDMTVDQRAFSLAMVLRAPHIFGIASQVYFRNPKLRREETGWTTCRFAPDGMIETGDEAAGDNDEAVRGVFYPGAGAALFRRSLLREMAGKASVYAPFYWEDVEWGACAWRLGYESVYCPLSKVWHGHRQTNREFFSEREIDRILRRNRFVYHFRNGPCAESFTRLSELVARLDQDSLDEILARRRMFAILSGRLRNRSRHFSDIPMESTWQLTFQSERSAIQQLSGRLK